MKISVCLMVISFIVYIAFCLYYYPISFFDATMLMLYSLFLLCAGFAIGFVTGGDYE